MDSIIKTIDCPLFCKGGEGSVTIRGWGEPSTVQPCDLCHGDAWDVRFTDVEHYLPAPKVTAWQHRDGLVTFA